MHLHILFIHKDNWLSSWRGPLHPRQERPERRRGPRAPHVPHVERQLPRAARLPGGAHGAGGEPLRGGAPGVPTPCGTPGGHGPAQLGAPAAAAGKGQDAAAGGRAGELGHRQLVAVGHQTQAALKRRFRCDGRRPSPKKRSLDD